MSAPESIWCFNIYDDTTDQLVKRFYVQPGCEKSVSWICPKEGLYYIATAQINPEIYGEETEYTLKIFTPFILEPQTIEIGQGSSDIITIRGGKGPFVIDSIEDESIVTAKVFTQAGAFIQINGENRGTTTPHGHRQRCRVRTQNDYRNRRQSIGSPSAGDQKPKPSSSPAADRSRATPFGTPPEPLPTRSISP